STIGPALAVVVAVWAPPLLALGPTESVRMLLATVLLVWAPGYAVAAAARIADPLTFTMVALSVSLALNIAAAMALLYFGLWSVLALYVVTGVTALPFAVTALVRRLTA
ncbi:MAG: hypothetical protein ACRDXB_00655, partial [Actinomycetes bacterium]